MRGNLGISVGKTQVFNSFDWCLLQDYCPEYEKPAPLGRSKGEISIDELLEATERTTPFPWDEQTDARIGCILAEYWDRLLNKFFLSN